MAWGCSLGPADVLLSSRRPPETVILVYISSGLGLGLQFWACILKQAPGASVVSQLHQQLKALAADLGALSKSMGDACTAVLRTCLFGEISRP